MMATPFKILAQEARRKVVIAFPSGSEDEVRATPLVSGFMSGLHSAGYLEGKNLDVVIVSRGRAGDDYRRIAEVAVATAPDLILVNTVGLTRQIKALAKQIPIVAAVDDPAANGLISNSPTLGGNITGVDVNGGAGLYSARLELLHEAGLTFIRPAFLTPSILDLRNRVSELRPKWKNLIPVQLEDPISDSALKSAFRVMQDEGADALLVSTATLLALFASQVTALAREYRLPAVYPYRSYVLAGGLMSYGLNFFDLGKMAAGQAEQILRGKTPGEIPFYRTQELELILNMKAARALNVTLAAAVVARAGLVIE